MAGDPFPAMFAGLVDTIKRLASGEQQPAQPRHAATVVLLRDRGDGPQVYLLRRTASMAFAAGFFVFPGGSVDPRDESFADHAWVGPSPQQWARLLNSDEPRARSLVCAAVRETFEESGVLLAGPDAGSVVADTSGEDWEADRLALIDRSLSLADLLRRRQLVLRADLLRVWAHWITPEAEPKRFDTRFFVAAMPAGQRTRDVGGEADRVAWMRPADALAGAAAGELSMLPPTLSALTELAPYATVAEVLAAGEHREIEPVLPKLLLDEDDNIRFLLPADADYPKATVK
ncbi:MAG TPA: NUDIX hydrolase [Mycobacteriales bacterium]|jgi:8-oxo-dGTP pyrophosphatase MutT (NUDIX family)|nr:NUDIX hydrolase [Mycobacteriales bacterium]